ncbi:carboxylesterase 5A-like [Ostrinia nubilalis]|uniref:carboxylesterase 5A-like n=1 Tax=Ostrinia nubilalis TaxID=29057 RepID=UPI0030824328
MSSEVTIPQGNLKGSISFSGAYRRFLKVPYASVTGKFQAPGDPPSWKGTLNVARGSSRCKQYFSRTRTPIGFKDCLVLNVYTPTVALKTPLPVMVFIHGGGFYWGSNTHLLYNPKHLLKKQVIVVTVNYRLGAFGFLCLRNKGAPGNAGLKDQVAALKWISKNIEYFGGDPNSVTLFGESVGAASVNYLLVSPLTEGLFHRVILQSGSVLMPQAFDEDPIGSASLVATRLGYNSSDPDELLNIFNQVSEEDVTIETYRDQTNNAFAPYVFRPCLEEPTADAIITAPPRDLLNSSNLNSGITVIIGYNNKEGIKWASKYNSNGIKNLVQNFTQIIPHNLYFQSKNDKDIFVADVEKIYFGNKTLDNDILDGLINYFSDAFIMYPSVATTEYFLKYTNISVFNYFFKYDSYRNLLKSASGLRRKPGADHGDELFYLFEPVIYQSLLPLQANSNDYRIINKMTGMWTSFAKTGNPNSKESPNTHWTKSELNELTFLEIDREFQIISLPNKERIDFWKNVYEKYGTKND